MFYADAKKLVLCVMRRAYRTQFPRLFFEHPTFFLEFPRNVLTFPTFVLEILRIVFEFPRKFLEFPRICLEVLDKQFTAPSFPIAFDIL